MDDPLVAEGGEVADEPSSGDVTAMEVDMGTGEIGCYIEWKNLDDGWLIAFDTDSFVSLDSSL